MVSLPLVLIGASLTFISNLVGNHISFKHRIHNTLLATAFWLLCFFALYALQLTPSNMNYKVFTVVAALAVFASDLIGNSIPFDRRAANALVSTIVWAILFNVMYTAAITLGITSV
jgi:hypothetical protein